LRAWARFGLNRERNKDDAAAADLIQQQQATIERLNAALVELRKRCHSETRQGLLSIIDAALGKDASDDRSPGSSEGE
jgi:hypothetical protein